MKLKFGARKFNKCEKWILDTKDNYTYYLLCRPDIPWEPDPLRENPFDREIIQYSSKIFKK